jgi:hypothetical protein
MNIQITIGKGSAFPYHVFIAKNGGKPRQMGGFKTKHGAEKLRDHFLKKPASFWDGFYI